MADDDLFSFDEFETPGESDNSPVANYQAPVQIDDSVIEEAIEPTKMSEVEKRLSLAMLYQEWAKGDFYDNKNEVTCQVEAEFKAFAVERLNALIGIENAPKQVLQFTEEEVTALKALAAKILNNPKVLGPQKTEIKRPEVKVEKPKTEAKQVARPKLKRQATPEVIKAPLPSPVVKPAPTQAKPSTTVTQTTKQEPLKVYPEGHEYEKDGRRYRVRWVQTGASEFGADWESVLDKLPKKATTRILKDKSLQIYRTEGDELFKIIHQDLTPKAAVSGGIPFPASPAALTAATLSMATAGEQATDSRFRRSLGK